MKRQLTCIALVILAASIARPGVSLEGSVNSPSETVEELWLAASAGELLTLEGWQDVSGLFTEPLPPPKKVILVVSNHWGPAGRPEVSAHDTVVVVGCWEWGTIDAALRFTPAPKTTAVKEGRGYHLVFAPQHFRTFKNGKLVEDGTNALDKRWQITKPLDMPFTTVNTAIRYVLEKRDKTTNPVIKQNADKTLAALLRLD